MLQGHIEISSVILGGDILVLTLLLLHAPMSLWAFLSELHIEYLLLWDPESLVRVWTAVMVFVQLLERWDLRERSHSSTIWFRCDVRYSYSI